MSIAFDPDEGLHVSSYPHRGTLYLRSKTQLRALLQHGRDRYPVLVYIAAALQVQRFWRGVLLRRRVLQHYLQGGFTRRWWRDEGVIRDAYRIVPKPTERDLMDLTTVVQSRWRTALLRHEFQRWSSYDAWPIYYVAAATIQRTWVDYCYVKKQRQHKNRSKRMYASREDSLAGRIQLAWRGYVNRQIFAFYKKLVQYREGNDAVLMLRAINASEAFLMDPAAGLHVRFRLGGMSFPPVVLYKIYTHRPVADIGAFAPKDYTALGTRKDPRMVHNAVDLNRRANGAQQMREAPTDKTRWYQRVENNQWRAVSEDVFTGSDAGQALPDDVKTVWEQRCARFLVQKTAGASSKPTLSRSTWRRRPTGPPKFHAVAAKRRDVKTQRSKETRRRWLVELYAAEQEVHSRATRETVRSDAAALFETLSDAEVDAETRKLTEWTEHLDFESYHRSWQRLATTAPSDAAVAVAASQST